MPVHSTHPEGTMGSPLGSMPNLPNLSEALLSHGARRLRVVGQEHRTGTCTALRIHCMCTAYTLHVRCVYTACEPLLPLPGQGGAPSVPAKTPPRRIALLDNAKATFIDCVSNPSPTPNPSPSRSPSRSPSPDPDPNPNPKPDPDPDPDPNPNPNPSPYPNPNPNPR